MQKWNTREYAFLTFTHFPAAPAWCMEDNEMLYKLKEMEYVERIAEKINTISVSGNNQVVDQLKQIFSPAKK